MSTKNHKPTVLIGAGGHARVLLSALRRAGREVLFITDLKAADGAALDGVPVRSDDAAAQLDPAEVELVLAVGSVEPSMRRTTIAESWSRRGFHFSQVVDPTALVCEPSNLGEGCQILAGCIVQPGATIGAHAILNTGASVDHDCTIGAFVHLAPGATLSGAVTIGERSHLGTGCSVVHGVHVGASVLVAAGAVVVGDVGAGARVAGTPARRMETPEGLSA